MHCPSTHAPHNADNRHTIDTLANVAQTQTSPDAPPAANAGAPLLVARGLRRTLDERVLWHDLALTLHAGERWAIAGASGTGKTVLLRTLAGLAPLESGELLLDDKPFRDWWPPAWRARVGYLPQRPALPEGSVEAALAAPFQLRVHRMKAYSAAAASRMLAAVGIKPEFLQKQTADLSGGEGQVAAVLRGLLVEPTILLLDEPTASLDPTRTQQVEALITAWLAGDPQRACAWTSHDPAQLARVSDHRLSLDGTT